MYTIDSRMRMAFIKAYNASRYGRLKRQVAHALRTNKGRIFLNRRRKS